MGLDVLYDSGISSRGKIVAHDESGDREGIKTGAVLNLIGDAIHNFTDGMAMHQLSMSENIGRSVTIAVLCMKSLMSWGISQY